MTSNTILKPSKLSTNLKAYTKIFENIIKERISLAIAHNAQQL